MDLSPFDFDLPEDLIALRPAPVRDLARLLVVRGEGKMHICSMRDLPQLLEPSDTLVFNDTRVLPAALEAVRPARATGGQDVAVDLNLVAPVSGQRWRALARPGKRLQTGDVLEIAPGFTATVAGKGEGGEVLLDLNCPDGDLHAALEAYGKMPLPPYIARRRAADDQDRSDYQTRFAGEEAASVAAPTAGLHFSDALLQDLEQRQIGMARVRLHVGLGTFAPMNETTWTSGRLHEEWRRIDAETALLLNRRRASGGRIIPVGTTAMRTLESAVGADGHLQAVSGPTDIFIRPGDAIRATDGLVTNFHLPRSSLFMLVCALMGTDLMQRAYAFAIREKMRFYSYGDACLLLP